jgi:uncharacterized membrane protein
MYTVPVEYVVAVFDTQAAAENAMQGFFGSENEALYGIKESALLHKDADGKLHIQEPHDAGFTKGAAIGGVVGALLGVVTGPGVVAVSAAGAMVGGLASKLHDTGFDNKDLKELAKSLKPGTSALLLVVEDRKLGDVNRQLAAAEAKIVTDALNPKVAEELQAEYAAFIDKLKERGMDGLTAKDWTSVSDAVDRSQYQYGSQFGSDYIDPMVEVKG